MRANPLLLTAAAFSIGAGCIDNTIDDQDDVVDARIYVTETFQQTPLPELDILWVVDNTASMAEEQAALADSFVGFIDALEAEALSWQVGVISADMTSDGAGVLQGSPWILTPASEEPAASFADMVDVGLDGVGPEAGLAATLAALSAPLIEDENLGFRRESAALHVVVVSDADDSSEAWLGDDPAGEALDFLADEEARTGAPARLSAVVGDPVTGCSGDTGQATPGDTYAEVAEASDGAISSICDGDLSEAIALLGALSVDYQTDFPLQAEPQGAPQVWVDGAEAVDGWSLLSEPPTIRFDEPPPGGSEIEVSYWLTLAEGA